MEWQAPDDELLDIVDTGDCVTGQKLRSEFYKEGASNFRVINAFIVNSDGKIWIPRRSERKGLFPLCLDASVGGHVKSGESYEQALKRELNEELQIHLENVEYKLLGYLNPLHDKVSAFMKVYEIKTDNAPAFNRDDFVDAYWLYPQEIIAKLYDQDIAKEDLEKLMRRFYINQ